MATKFPTMSELMRPDPTGAPVLDALCDHMARPQRETSPGHIAAAAKLAEVEARAAKIRAEGQPKPPQSTYDAPTKPWDGNEEEEP